MLENASVQVAPVVRRRQRPRLPIEAQARRVEELRRGFQRALNRRPTLIEKAAMLRAAALVARAEAAALDPTMPVGELTKLINIADRACRRLPLDGLRRRPTPTMREVLEGEGESEAEAGEPLQRSEPV
jgi:hypothetical protein